MAKRFTDTDKWKKKFIKSLPTEYKLFWLFLLDECDHSGIWHIEMEVAEARLGIKLSLEKIRGLFKERVVEFDGGSKLFIPDFIHFQYGKLSPGNNTHNSVLKSLEKYGLQGLLSPSRGVMDTDKDKEQDKDKDKPPSKENDSTVFYDAEEVVLSNPIKFEQICMVTGRLNAETAKNDLRVYHLYLQEKNHYPMTKKQIFAGYEKWLRNEKKFNNGNNQTNTGSGRAKHPSGKDAGANSLLDELQQDINAG